MSGFQVFNDKGAVVIDSDYFGTYFRDSKSYGAVTDTGIYNITTPIGNTSDMGYVSGAYPLDGNLQWFKFSNGAKAVLCNGNSPLATANAGTMARTGTDVPIVSGYRDVYNASGQLVWSAVSAAKIPRVMGFFDIPAGFTLDTSVYSQNIGTNTWLLASNCPANLSYGDSEGSLTGYSGLFFRFDSGNLQAYWINQSQRSWAQTFQPYGLRIPYAILSNLS
ncbi:hypothetical protein ACMGEE_01570 [Erwinia sp. DT-104]|uniref:hypothetical protein n=1 Tax=Erwinia sp. DT-104 TaxID=3396161 RepID=UPI003F1A4EDF